MYAPSASRKLARQAFIWHAIGSSCELCGTVSGFEAHVLSYGVFVEHEGGPMHDSKSTPVLRRCDSAVEPDAAIEHIGMAWLSTIDDVTLI